MTEFERIGQVRRCLPRLPQMTCFDATYYYLIPANKQTPSSAFQDSFDKAEQQASVNKRACQEFSLNSTAQHTSEKQRAGVPHTSMGRDQMKHANCGTFEGPSSLKSCVDTSMRRVRRLMRSTSAALFASSSSRRACIAFCSSSICRENCISIRPGQAQRDQNAGSSIVQRHYSSCKFQ
jgi:hypothetical protein